MKKIAVAILGLGLAAVAAWLEISGETAYWLWVGVVICFFGVI